MPCACLSPKKYERCYIMALNENKKDDYRSERKERIAKASKKSAKTHDSVAVVRGVLIAVLVVAVLASVCGGLYAYGIPQRYITALKVGDRSYSVAEYNYYYASVYQTYAYQAQSYQSQYGFTLGFDPAVDPAAQTTKQDDEEITYDQFFRNYIEETLESNSYYIGLANDAGMTLSDESKESIDSTISDIQDACKDSGYSVDRYISLLYGKGLNEKILRNLLEEQYLVSQYRTDEEEKLSDGVSMEDIEAKYAEDPTDYQKVNVRLFGFEIPDDDTETESGTAADVTQTDETAVSDAETTEAADTSTDADASTEAEEEENKEPSEQEKLAEEMLAKITDEASFAKLAKEYAAEDDKETFEDDTATILNGVSKSTVSSNIDSELAEWLFDASRAAGDKTTCTTDKYVYVIYVTKPVYRVETPLASARHILISFANVKSSMESAGESTDGDDADATASDGTVVSKNSEYSVDVVLKTYEQAKSILDEYKAGEQTEDAFAALANENSADTSSTEDDNGGLYEDIELGKMVAPFENWVYDESRQVGDVGLIESTYGWHVMYFVGKHDEAEWIETIRESIVSEKMTEAEDAVKEQTKDYAATTSFTSLAAKNALKFVNDNYVTRYASQS